MNAGQILYIGTELYAQKKAVGKKKKSRQYYSLSSRWGSTCLSTKTSNFSQEYQKMSPGSYFDFPWLWVLGFLSSDDAEAPERPGS